MSLMKQKNSDNSTEVQEGSQISKTTFLEGTSNILSAESPSEHVSEEIVSQQREEHPEPQARGQDLHPCSPKERDQHDPFPLEHSDHRPYLPPPRELEQDQYPSPSENAQMDARSQEFSETILPSEERKYQELPHAELEYSDRSSDGKNFLKGPKFVEGVEGIATAEPNESSEVRGSQENIPQAGIALQQTGANGPLVFEKTLNNASVPAEPEPNNPSSIISNIEDADDAKDSSELHMVDKSQAQDNATVSINGLPDSTVYAMRGKIEGPEKDTDIKQNHSESPIKPDPDISLVGESPIKPDIAVSLAGESGSEFPPQVRTKPLGLISLLDEESTFPNGTDLSLAIKLKQHLNGNSSFKGERGRAFCICHYAGEVVYDTTGILEKNRDFLHADLLQLLSSCNVQLPQEFASNISKGAPKSSSPLRSNGSESQKQSVATKFKAKADEITRLLNENEQLKNTIEDLKKKSPETESDALREEYQQRLGTLERKIRDLEEEKQRLNSKLQVEEAKVESIKRDKAAFGGGHVPSFPESTRPLLRQIEAMQETSAMRAEAWTGVERALNSRLQEAEAKAASAEERERAINERLSQTLSRMAVLEAQVSCLRAEQAQLTRSLEKERQRASENRQEYLAALETAASQEGRAKQLEDEIRELRNQHKHELVEEMARRELLEKELELERATRLDLEKTVRLETWAGTDRNPSSRHTNSYLEHGTNNHLRRFSSTGSARNFAKGMVPSTLEHLEATLRQKDGELSSYMARLASLESIRDSLAEELVKMTNQCEKLRIEVSALPGLNAELEALRRRHASALELMGERDEELEELRADLADVKEMYREQVDMLVSQIEKLSSSLGSK